MPGDHIYNMLGEDLKHLYIYIYFFSPSRDKITFSRYVQESLGDHEGKGGGGRMSFFIYISIRFYSI